MRLCLESESFKSSKLKAWQGTNVVLSTHGAVEGKERDRESCAAEDGLCQEEVQEVP